jgi:hypothetical protein
MAAADFFTVEVWTLRGLVAYYVLFVMRLKTRSVNIAGVTTAPNAALGVRPIPRTDGCLY